MKQIQLKDIILFGGMIVLILLVVFHKKPDQIFDISPIKEVETRIEGKETQIKHFETKVVQDKKAVAEIAGQLDLVRQDLAKFRSQRDTFKIVQIQDTLINGLTAENWHLRSIVGNQDSIIVAQRYIINSKDTLIAIGKHDIKRIKKQRNASILINALLTAIAIFK